MPYVANLEALLIAPKEAARREGAHVETIYRRLREGVYKARRVGGAWRIYTDEDGMPQLAATGQQAQPPVRTRHGHGASR